MDGDRVTVAIGKPRVFRLGRAGWVYQHSLSPLSFCNHTHIPPFSRLGVKASRAAAKKRTAEAKAKKKTKVT